MGIKQTVGASKWSLCLEIIVNRLGYLVLSTALTFLFLELIFPFYQSFLTIEVDRSPWMDLLLILGVNTGIVIISSISSISRVVQLTAGESLVDKKMLLKIPRIQRGLTTVQFFATIILLVATTVVFVQFSFMKNKDTGLNQQGIISIDFMEMMTGNRSSDSRKESERKYQLIKHQLAQNPDIITVSQGDMPISSVAEPNSWKRKGQSGDYTSENKMIVDPGYADLLGLRILEGRFFSDSLDQSGQRKVVLNESAMKYWGIDEINSEKLLNYFREEEPYTIIGVVEDYHYEHLSNAIKPLVLVYNTSEDRNFLIQYRQGKESSVVAFLEELFDQVNPKGVFTYEVLSDKVEAQYHSEKRIGNIYVSLTVVALLLSSTGLFIFALHETRRRTKEIGIRKVNGATIGNVFGLLSKSFLKSVAIACLAGLPISWLLMNEWLQNFAYRTNLSWWIFLSATVILILASLLAVGVQIFEVAKKNPVDSLRYE